MRHRITRGGGENSRCDGFVRLSTHARYKAVLPTFSPHRDLARLLLRLSVSIESPFALFPLS